MAAVLNYRKSGVKISSGFRHTVNLQKDFDYLTAFTYRIIRMF